MLTNPRYNKMLDVSTAHITNETCNVFLNDPESPVCSYSFEYGQFVFVHDPEEIEGRVPEDLLDCIKAARWLDCDWIKFDCDGTIYPELKTYNW